MSVKIGILTFHNKNNYGAVLQTYALFTVLEKLGYEPIILDRYLLFKEKVLTDGFLSTFKQSIALKIENNLLARGFHDFRVKNYKRLSKPFKNKKELTRFINGFYAVIVGSDQVWRLAYTKKMLPNYFLDFVPDGVRKISYAASFGVDFFEGTADLSKEIAELLQRFHAISVREDAGILICRDQFNTQATQVLDPTLLLLKNEYERLFDLDRSVDTRYVSEYFLDSTEKKKGLSQTMAILIGCDEVLNITRNKKYSLSKPTLFFKDYTYPSVSYWLEGILNSDFVVTDSFHGVAFSILFNKQFVCIQNPQRGTSRIQSLLKKLDIQGAILNEDDMISSRKDLFMIDYSIVNQKLEKEKQKSFEFLNSSLK